MKKVLFHSSPILFWFVIALGIRIFSAFTHTSWHHPDEWFQTVEFGNLLAHGFGYYSQEMGLHLRNMTWASLLSVPLWISEKIFPEQIVPRVYLTTLYVGLLSLGIFWGWLQMMQRLFSEKLKFQNPFWIHFGFGLLLLPWFTVYESVSPRAETISNIFLWVALGFIARRNYTLSGFFSVGSFAFRYPSLLFFMGIATAVFINAFFNKEKKIFYWFILGSLCGAIVFGLSDWVIYGRPWESLWMYLQYNLFTGMSGEVYGTQDLSAYADYFSWRYLRFGGMLAPFALLLLVFSFFGVIRGLWSAKPWAFALVFYSIPHVWTAHKEARFLLPIETLLFWASLEGCVIFSEMVFTYRYLHLQSQRVLKSGKIFLILFAVLNVGFLLKETWGEVFRASSNFFEIDRHLQDHPETCGIISIKHPLSLLLPWKRSEILPSTPYAYLRFLPGDRRYASFEHAQKTSLEWVEREAICNGKNQKILLQVHKPHPVWEQNGCVLLRTGILKWLPDSMRTWLLDRNYVSGPWYVCQPSIRTIFPSEKVVNRIAYKMGKIQTLPPLGISGKGLLELGLRTTVKPKDGL